MMEHLHLPVHLLFFVVIGIGVWYYIKTRKKEASCEATRSEIALDKRISLFGIIVPSIMYIIVLFIAYGKFIFG